jgi:phenylacetate-coenzyme A ligase PaaK-like adenylate-forming protein
MRIVRAARAAAYQRRIDAILKVRAEFGHPEERRAYQLRLFNEQWARTLATAPYYQDLARRLKLPVAFPSWDEFKQLVPQSSRELVQRRTREMSSRERKTDFFRTTGGSTAEPIQLPAWNSESWYATSDLWYGRREYGVTPSSRLFALWGHSHLMGRGFRGWINRTKRRLRDSLIDFHRYSAYDLTPAAMARAAEVILRFKPDFILGYSVALDTFARVNSQLRAELRALRVKAVIAAAEAFPFSDSMARLQDLFNAPIAMEYGSVETNLIAHTRRAGGYEVFWWRYFVELDPVPAPSGGRSILVTSLYPRCFPLIRYALGDEIVNNPESENTSGVAEFERVLGRCNDYVTLPSGEMLHSEFFTHAVRGCREIQGYQVAQTPTGVQLSLQGGAECNEDTVERVRRNLLNVDSRLAAVRIIVVAELVRTRAGKTPMVVSV